MKIKKLLFLSIFISLNTFAALDGEYSKTNGPQSCPEGNIHYKEIKEDKQKVLIFGVRHSWTFNLDLTKKQFSEPGEEGECHYDYSYDLSEKSISYKTKRSKCADSLENAAIHEVFTIDKQLLTYTFKSTTDDKKVESFECTYKKKK